VNVKETGRSRVVDYSDIKNLKETEVEAARFLHTALGTPPSATSFVAANQSNKVAVVDAKESKLAGLSTSARSRTRGRGATSSTRSSGRSGPPGTWATRRSR